jgi:DNA-binding LacI/PurR family transcriptional regulator
MSNNLGISIRQIAATAGVSHPTVSAAIKRSKIREEA